MHGVPAAVAVFLVDSVVQLNLYEFIVLPMWRLTVRFLTELRFLQNAVCQLVSFRTVAAARLPACEALCQDWEPTLSKMESRESGLNPMCGGAAGR